MPTNTVKDVSGRDAVQNTGPWKRVGSKCPPPSFVKRTHNFPAGKALWVLCAFVVFATFTTTKAQTLDVRISVTSTAPGRIKINARLPAATNALSFRNTYAGVLGLGERIEDVEGIKDDGERVRVSRLAPGEFQSAERFAHFNYEVNLTQPLRAADLSHVSSLHSDHGALMMADLLPQSTRSPGGFTSAIISLEVPSGWRIASNVKNKDSRYSTDDPETAVFLIGPSVHEKSRRFAKGELSVVMTGKWPFSDGDATKIAAEILEQYSRATQFELKRNAVVMLVPYPGEAGPASWSAETRGNVVVLLLGQNASRKSVLSRLGIVLSHELFHLWVPNSLKLEGAYDWFFEGFTLYQALQMDLRLGLISFNDYLETIASVYDSYRSSADRNRLSLIEASERRWTTSSSLVYEKGMLVAFIYDLSLKKHAGCLSSLDMIYAELFRRAAAGQTSANETIINLLSERDELKSFSKEYVESTVDIDLEPVVSAFGIQVQREGSRTKLVVPKDLSSAQRNLLGCIGYRN